MFLIVILLSISLILFFIDKMEKPFHLLLIAFVISFIYCFFDDSVNSIKDAFSLNVLIAAVINSLAFVAIHFTIKKFKLKIAFEYLLFIIAGVLYVLLWEIPKDNFEIGDFLQVALATSIALIGLNLLGYLIKVKRKDVIASFS